MSLLTNRNTDIIMSWNTFLDNKPNISIGGLGQWYWKGTSESYREEFIEGVIREGLDMFPQPSDKIIRALVSRQRRFAQGDKDFRMDEEFNKYFKVCDTIINDRPVTSTIWFKTENDYMSLWQAESGIIERDLFGSRLRFVTGNVFFTLPGTGDNTCWMKICIDWYYGGRFASATFRYFI